MVALHEVLLVEAKAVVSHHLSQESWEALEVPERLALRVKSVPIDMVQRSSVGKDCRLWQVTSIMLHLVNLQFADRLREILGKSSQALTFTGLSKRTSFSNKITL